MTTQINLNRISVQKKSPWHPWKYPSRHFPRHSPSAWKRSVLRVSCLLTLSPQPKRHIIAVHDVIGDQGCPIMDEHHAPLQMNTDLIGPLRKFAKPEAPVCVRVAKSRRYFGDCPGNFSTKAGRQFGCGFPDSFRKQHFNHNAPVKISNPPVSRDAAISASARSSASVA